MRTILQSYKGLTASLLVFTMSFVLGYSAVEPKLLQAVGDQFIITQSVTAEISFITTANDVAMNGSIAGLTGGTSNGSTQVAVLTNNAAGYTMVLQASSSPAMQGDTQGGYINDYTPGTPLVPDYTFSVGSNTGEFAYTVSASTTSDLDSKFLDNGSACDAGGSSDTSGSDSCWLNASTTDVTIIDRGSATGATGATTTIYFRVQITANPSPAIPQDTYTATTTLTATTK
ncbi:MAG: hypothetical protein WDZ88_01700 [Candidatus Paceibacterota bacterium]